MGHRTGEAMQPSATSSIANFDSATGMLRATAKVLHGKDFPNLGQPRLVEPLTRLSNLFSPQVREEIYALGGLQEALSPSRLSKVDAETIASWVTSSYPKRRYQAVMVGASNGALVNLCALLDTPWLPQSHFIPVRHVTGDNDDPKGALAFGKRFGPDLLAANPELKLHQMHDGSQDRLMADYMDYFRVKRLALGKSYEHFMQTHLAPGGTILVVDCQRKWPTTTVGERHVFQHGGLGGVTEDEYLHGGPRVREFLERYDAPVREWDSPEPDGESPEAEWGYEPALTDDILRFAAQHGFRVKRIVFKEPEDLSPLVANFYRNHYHQRGLKANRLLVGSFAINEPYWALRTGSVPFWMKFNMEPSAEALEDYLATEPAFEEINLMLINHGVEGIGLPSVERWKRLLSRATRCGRFIGVREELFPRDFGSFSRYHTQLKKRISARYPLPGPTPLGMFTNFLDRSSRAYNVRIVDQT